MLTYNVHRLGSSASILTTLLWLVALFESFSTAPKSPKSVKYCPRGAHIEFDEFLHRPGFYLGIVDTRINLSIDQGEFKNLEVIRVWY